MRLQLPNNISSDTYNIVDITTEELEEFIAVLDSCKLPQKRTFFNLKESITKILSSKGLPKKKK